MTAAQAITLALECIRKEIKYLAPEANMHELAGADYPSAIKAAQRRAQLREAIALLEQLPIQERLL